MKFKSLLLSAAIAATTFSGMANAAIDGQGSVNSINSDLVLYIYDTVKDLSYVQNLDVNYKDIIAQNGSFGGTFNLNAAALNIFSTSDTNNLVWGLGSASADFLDPDGSTIGSVLTANNPGAESVDYGQIDGMNQKFNNLITAANLFTPIGTANASYATGATASLLSGGVKGYYERVGYQVGFANSASVNTAQNLWFVHLSADYDVTAPALMSVNPWTLNLADATVVSAVPLPAAAWLMFSALMGLGGIARRRSAKA